MKNEEKNNVTLITEQVEAELKNIREYAPKSFTNASHCIVLNYDSCEMSLSTCQKMYDLITSKGNGYNVIVLPNSKENLLTFTSFEELNRWYEHLGSFLKEKGNIE